MELPRNADTDHPWQWEKTRWRSIVDKVRAGRSLKPAKWKEGARVAVALSFDSDHETLTLRSGDTSPSKLSQGQYGNRVAIPRILAMLARHGIPATFFVPAVVAMLYPDEQREVVAAGHEIGIHGWIHEFNGKLPPVDERDLQMRAADTLERIAGVRPVGIRTPSWDFSQHTLAISREMGLLYDSSLMADDEPYELLEDGEPTGIVELPVEWIRDDAVYFYMDRFSSLRPYTPAVRGAGDIQARVRRSVPGARIVPPDHAPAHHRAPLAAAPGGGARRVHVRPRRRVVRDPRGRCSVLPCVGLTGRRPPLDSFRSRIRGNPDMVARHATKCYRLVAFS